MLAAAGMLVFMPVQARSTEAAGKKTTTAGSGKVMSAETRSAAVRAVKAIKNGEWTKGKNLLAGTRDPVAIKLYAWLAYTREYGEPDFINISTFIKDNPDWPMQGKLQMAAEKAMPSTMAPPAVTAWFDHYPPQTSDGINLYMKALIAQGKTTAAQDVMRGWWPKATLTPEQQAKFIDTYSRFITNDMQAARINSLILRERYTNARAIARRMGRGYPQLVEARVALAEGAAGVAGAINAVPPHLKDDPGLLYERLRWRRRNDQDVGAIEILHKQPSPDKIPNLEDWWTERNILIRRLIERKQYESAYLLAAGHRQLEGAPLAEAEFLAGWLALRFLNQPWKAFEHFEILYHKTVTPISRARGAYWAGRASEALGHQEVADKWYHVAAQHQTVFYGQMAVGELAEEQRPPQQLPPPRTIPGEAAFVSNDLTQVAKIMHDAGQWKETTQFLDALADKAQAPETVMLAAELAKKLEHYNIAVKIAKKALQNNIMITDYAYPTLLGYMRNVNVEWALVHGLIRQESMFDLQALSSAGARGLMQLMPATAAETAKKAGMEHRQEWLASRPAHNVTLGSLYLAQMLRRYDGNYALALAAYNGGPGRVDRWLKENGDPRKGQIDLIDWIELIPVGETRNYVQRVLEGVYVYRLKLQGVQKSAESPIHVSFKKTR